MKSVRLNSSKREDIVSSVLSHWDKTNPPPETKQLESILAEEMYNLAFSEKVRELIEKTEISQFLNFSRDFMVKVEDEPYGNELKSFSLSKSRPLPHSRSYNGPVILVLSTSTESLKKLVQEQQELILEKRRNLVNEVKRLLNSVNSTKELIEIWPEVQDLLPSYLIENSTSLVVSSVPVSELNEKLGLGK